jgi:hypothetical protein
VLTEDLDYCVMVLSYFGSRRLAESFFAEITDNDVLTLAEHADAMLDDFEAAMRDYANMGRGASRMVNEYDEARQAVEHGDVRPRGVEPGGVETRTPEHKTVEHRSIEPMHSIDRDGLCPCGSGKPYRKCCLQ